MTRDAGCKPATDALMQLSRIVTAVVARTLADAQEVVTIPQLCFLVMLYDDSPINLSAIAQSRGGIAPMPAAPLTSW